MSRTSVGKMPQSILPFLKYALACLLLAGSARTAGAQQPVFNWARLIGGVSGGLTTGIATDKGANVYTLGTMAFGATDFDPGPDTFILHNNGTDAFVQKLNAAGNFVWATHIGSANATVAPAALTLDSTGNLYLTGRFNGTVDFDPGPGTYSLTASGGNANIFICKLDTAANLLWARNIGSTGLDEGTAIAVDRWGNVYTTGRFSGVTDFNPGTGTYNLTALNFDVFISKLDGAGNFVWAKDIGSTYNDMGYSLALDDSANVYTSGTFAGTVDFDPGTAYYPITSYNNGTDAFVSKLDSGGNFVWAKHFSASDQEVAASIVSDRHGNIVIGGWFNNPMDADPNSGVRMLTRAYRGCYDYFLIKLTTGGNYVWGKVSGHPVMCIQDISLASDSAGNIYATGCYGDTSDFDPGPGVYNMNTFGAGSPTTDHDIFLTRLNADGSFGWARGINSPGQTDMGTAIAIDPFNNILSSGFFVDSADMDPGPGVSKIRVPDVDPNYSEPGVYVHKMSPCSATTAGITATACKLYVLNGQTYTSTGTYTQMRTNATGCDSVITLSLTINNVVTDVAQAGGSLAATTTGAAYQWLDCNNNRQPIGGATGRTFTPTANGSYAIAITANGCTDTSACISVMGVGIPALSFSSFVNIYPNPASGVINLGYDAGVQVQAIRLVDMMGTVVRTFKADHKVLDLEGLAAGVYHLQVQTAKGMVVEKVVVR